MSAYLDRTAPMYRNFRAVIRQCIALTTIAG